MRRPLATLGPAALSLALLIGTAGCAPSDAPAPASSPAQRPGPAPVVAPDAAVELISSGERTVIDVRTPAEFAAGHVAGALNIDVTAPDFADRVRTLDPASGYLVYCQSGNRSAAAAEAMVELGFDDVIDAAAFADLASAGAPVQEGP